MENTETAQIQNDEVQNWSWVYNLSPLIINLDPLFDASVIKDKISPPEARALYRRI